MARGRPKGIKNRSPKERKEALEREIENLQRAQSLADNLFGGNSNAVSTINRGMNSIRSAVEGTSFQEEVEKHLKAIDRVLSKAIESV